MQCQTVNKSFLFVNYVIHIFLIYIYYHTNFIHTNMLLDGYISIFDDKKIIYANNNNNYHSYFLIYVKLKGINLFSNFRSVSDKYFYINNNKICHL